MKRISTSLLLIVLTIYSHQIFASNDTLKVMSYNVENLFDVEHDEGKEDYEYLPKSHPLKSECKKVEIYTYRKKCFETDWTQERLDLKLNQIKKLMDQVGLPDVLAVQEVENKKVLSMLAKALGFSGVVLIEGKDSRGIDVGLLYNESDSLKFLSSESHAIKDKVFKGKATRDILEVKFSIGKKEKLHIFVNHWPSQGNKSEARVAAAKKLNELMSKRLRKKRTYVLAMGDFNTVEKDHPHPFRDTLLKSKRKLGMKRFGRIRLPAIQKVNEIVDVHEEFLTTDKIKSNVKWKFPKGTYFYPSSMDWNVFDRFFISNNMMNEKSKLKFDIKKYKIHSDELFTKTFVYGENGRYDNDYLTGSSVVKTPKRYDVNVLDESEQGFSDHLPVSLELQLN